LTARASIVPCHDIDEGGFARAVRAQQSSNFALHHLQTHPIQGLHACEGFGEVVDIQKYFV
jgi:hypothetical protein